MVIFIFPHREKEQGTWGSICDQGEERMRIAINAINLTSAGTLVTCKEFLAALSSLKTSHHYLVTAPRGFGYEQLRLGGRWEVRFFPGWKKANPLWRIWFDFFLFPSMVQNFQADAVMALGNHAPARLPVPVLVLLRNSFYVDTDRYSLPSLGAKVRKYLETRVFSRTARHADIFVVQSNYMKARLASVWKVEEKRICVIPNAVAGELLAGEETPARELRQGREEKPSRPSVFDHKMIWLYVSRYYPHKNHQFILSLAEYLKNLGIDDLLFIVTLDQKLPGVQALLEKIDRQGLSEAVVNAGELSADQLRKWYQWADGLFFPSYQESFGNPLLEAMRFGLPVCAVDLPYSRALCDDSAIYYQVDSVADAAQKILSLRENPSFRAELARKGREKFSTFPQWNEVARSYLSVLEARM
ncbi:MAG: glycosyltransferase [bacterium]